VDEAKSEAKGKRQKAKDKAKGKINFIWLQMNSKGNV
jgi:hypothetical protein